jgi:hypothetical protein
MTSSLHQQKFISQALETKCKTEEIEWVALDWEALGLTKRKEGRQLTKNEELLWYMPKM